MRQERALGAERREPANARPFKIAAAAAQARGSARSPAGGSARSAARRGRYAGPLSWAARRGARRARVSSGDHAGRNR